MFSEKWYGGSGLSSVSSKGKKVLILWGGEDISPFIYGQQNCKHVYAPKTPSARDRTEISLVEEASKNNIPIIGVCRGAQLLCALAGGKLIQHVSGHAGDHPIVTNDGVELRTSSLHHQMLLLKDIEHKLLAWSSPKRSDTYIGEDDKEIEMCHEETFKEPEIVYLPKLKALCIQGHPEYMRDSDNFVKHVKTLVEEYVFTEQT